MKLKIFKLCVLIAVIITLVYLTIELIPLFRGISTEQGRIYLKSEIDKLGLKGAVIIIGLMLAQIFLAFLPGEPVEVLAGMCYGPIGGLIVIYIGAFISSLIIFYAVRKFGRNFIYSFVSKEKIDKLEHSKLLLNQKKLNMILFILFFIPGLPKDILVYIGGLLPVKASHFIMVSTFARFPSIISSTIAGSNIIAGNWNTIIWVYLITFSISGLILYLINKKDTSVMEIMK